MGHDPWEDVCPECDVCLGCNGHTNECPTLQGTNRCPCAYPHDYPRCEACGMERDNCLLAQGESTLRHTFKPVQGG